MFKFRNVEKNIVFGILGVIMLFAPMFVFSQTKGVKAGSREIDQSFRGTVKYFIYEDENLFTDRSNVDWIVAPPPLKAQYSYKLSTKDGNYIDLDESGVDWSAFANRKVSVQGSLVDQGDRKVLKVSPSSVKALEPPLYGVATIPPVTQGDMKVLVVAITVQQPGFSTPELFMTPEEALAPVFTNTMSAKAFYQQISALPGTPNGLLKVVGRINRDQGDAVFVTITDTITNCDQQKTSTWPALIDAQIRLQSIEPNNYNTTMFVFDDMPGCGTQSLATVGSIGLLNSRQTIWTNHAAVVGSFGDHMASHEMLHTLGLSHSNAYRCTDPANIPASCTNVEYGDQADVMGGMYFSPNVYQRRRLGWVYSPFKQLLYSGKYEVYSPAIAGQGGAKRLMSCQYCFIPLTGSLAGFSLYLEARQNFPPFDNLYQNGTLLFPSRDGVKLIIGKDDLTYFAAQPWVIDTHPTASNTFTAPLLLDSYTINNTYSFVHYTVTNPRTGSGVSVSIP